MKYVLTAIVIVLVFASCKEGWTDEYKNEYLETCREGARSWAPGQQAVDDYCNCALQHTMQHYSTIEEVIENADSTQISAEIDSCRAAVAQ